MTEKPPLLMLVQRIPYPPDKGDKIRSYNILLHLARRYDIYLGSCIDDPADEAHLPALRKLVKELHVERISRRHGLARAAWHWAFGLPLSFGFFKAPGLDRWVQRVMADIKPEVAFFYSSNIGLPLLPHRAALRTLVGDFVDVDSQKWRDYAATKSGPAKWLYNREAARTHTQEARLGAALEAVTFVSQDEAALFRSLHPGLADKTYAVSNGVDLSSFNPNIVYPKPETMGPQALVFTGRMDYWPNVDAVTWFAREVMPRLRARLPDVQFFIVGGAPTAQVLALASVPDVCVTGRVADVQPYLQHSLAAVAPMQIARGIQNKVLEALAMGRPTIVTEKALTGIDAPAGEAVLTATTPDDWIEAVVRIVADKAHADALGQAGRAFVEAEFGWAAKLAALDSVLA